VSALHAGIPRRGRAVIDRPVRAATSIRAEDGRDLNWVTPAWTDTWAARELLAPGSASPRRTLRASPPQRREWFPGRPEGSVATSRRSEAVRRLGSVGGGREGVRSGNGRIGGRVQGYEWVSSSALRGW
jgi:hypothetical protein